MVLFGPETTHIPRAKPKKSDYLEFISSAGMAEGLKIWGGRGRIVMWWA